MECVSEVGGEGECGKGGVPVEEHGQERAEQRAYPVEPVVAWEGGEDDVGCKGSGGVEGACNH